MSWNKNTHVQSQINGVMAVLDQEEDGGTMERICSCATLEECPYYTEDPAEQTMREDEEWLQGLQPGGPLGSVLAPSIEGILETYLKVIALRLDQIVTELSQISEGRS